MHFVRLCLRSTALPSPCFSAGLDIPTELNTKMPAKLLFALRWQYCLRYLLYADNLIYLAVAFAATAATAVK